AEPSALIEARELLLPLAFPPPGQRLSSESISLWLGLGPSPATESSPDTSTSSLAQRILAAPRSLPEELCLQVARSLTEESDEPSTGYAFLRSLLPVHDDPHGIRLQLVRWALGDLADQTTAGERERLLADLIRGCPASPSAIQDLLHLVQDTASPWAESWRLVLTRMAQVTSCHSVASLALLPLLSAEEISSHAQVLLRAEHSPETLRLFAQTFASFGYLREAQEFLAGVRRHPLEDLSLRLSLTHLPGSQSAEELLHLAAGLPDLGASQAVTLADAFAEAGNHALASRLLAAWRARHPRLHAEEEQLLQRELALSTAIQDERQVEHLARVLYHRFPSSDPTSLYALLDARPEWDLDDFAIEPRASY
ncbi:MAG: hypothetical protein AAF191_00605, partial [Verrucomicrobiota bacterium]